MNKEDLETRFINTIKEEAKRKEKMDSIKDKEIDMSKNTNSKLQWIFNHSKILDTIWGCILLVIISLIIYNVFFASKYTNIVKDIKPFSNQPTIGEELKKSNESGKWSECKIERFGQKGIEVKYEGKIKTTTDKIIGISITIDFEEGSTELGNMYYSIDNSEVNPLRFLNFLYNYEYKDIKKENVEALCYSMSDAQFNDMRAELGLNKVSTNNTKTSVNTNSQSTTSNNSSTNNKPVYNIKATKSISLGVMDTSDIITNVDKINNPEKSILVQNKELNLGGDANDSAIITNFLNSSYNDKNIIEYLKVMSISDIYIGDRDTKEDFYIFVNGTLNKVPIGLRFKYQNKNIYIMDSDVNDEANRRLSCDIIKSTIFK